MADTIKPTLKTLKMFINGIQTDTIDLSNGPVDVTFQATAQDNVAIQSLQWDFTTHPGGHSLLGGSFGIIGFTGGQSAQGSGTERAEVNTEDGDYSLTDITLTDTSFNPQHYTTADLQALGINTTIHVVHGDTQGPTLTRLDLPSVVSQGGPFTIHAEASDPAHVQRVIIYFDKNITPSGTLFQMFGLGNDDPWNDGTAVDGSTHTDTVAANTPNGTYTIARVDLTDTLGNVRTMSTQDLINAGFDTTVQVSNADIVAPTLTSLTFPASVDVHAGSKTITFNASGTDNVGVTEVKVHFDKNLSSGAVGDFVVDIPGTGNDPWSDDNASSQLISILNTAPPGIYSVTKVDIFDAAGNETSYTAAQLPAGSSKTLQILNDTVAPTLDDLQHPDTIDVTNGNVNAIFKAFAHDEGGGSGIRQVVVKLDNDFVDGTTGPFTITIGGSASDPWTDGSASITESVLTTTKNGTYNITEVDVTDNAGNTHAYNQSQLHNAGIDTDIVVTGAHTTGGTDTTPPDLFTIKFPKAVDISETNGFIQFDATGHDDSGIQRVTIWIDHTIFLDNVPDGAGGFILDTTFDDWSDGESKATWEILQDNSPDMYFIDHVDVVDIHGNSRTYTLDQLLSLHIIDHAGFFLLDDEFINVLPEDVIPGTPGNDVLHGTPANNVTIGGPGDDIITCGGGTDWLIGGQGNDTYHVISSTDHIIENVDEGIDRVFIQVNYILEENVYVEFIAVENVSVSVTINISGNSFAQTINGHDGIDVIDGRGGNDALNGGAGFDTAVFAGHRAAYTIVRNDASITVSGPDGVDSLTGIERLQFDDQSMLLHRAHNDFNGDGRSDVMFSNHGTVYNSNYEWQLNDRSLLVQHAIDLYDQTFNVQVVGDFDGDNHSDLLFRNPTTGGVWEWELNGSDISNQGAVDVADPSFDLLGAGDFNGDGKDDLIYRNDTGVVFMWEMNGRSDTPLLVGALDPKWHVQGTGDFNGDGKDDILLHYKNTSNAADPANGAFVVWQMNGNVVANALGIERPDASWQTLGIGDFNGDGVDDLAIRNVSNSGDNGAVWVYLLAGAVTTHGDGSKTLDMLGQGPAGIADAATWHLQQVGDLNGDGKDDFLYRNDSGFFYSWDMNGTHIASEGLLQGAAQWADPNFTVVDQHWQLV